MVIGFMFTIFLLCCVLAAFFLGAVLSDIWRRELGGSAACRVEPPASEAPGPAAEIHEAAGATAKSLHVQPAAEGPERVGNALSGAAFLSRERVASVIDAHIAILSRRLQFVDEEQDAVTYGWLLAERGRLRALRFNLLGRAK